MILSNHASILSGLLGVMWVAGEDEETNGDDAGWEEHGNSVGKPHSGGKRLRGWVKPSQSIGVSHQGRGEGYRPPQKVR